MHANGAFGPDRTLRTQRAAGRCIKHAVNEAGFNTPVVATAGISTFEQAESILRNGQADIVGFARQALADPDWFVKVKLGRAKKSDAVLIQTTAKRSIRRTVR